MDEVFDEYAQYYDQFYREKDYAREAEYVSALIRRYDSRATVLLELGSGTGKHAILLARQGFAVFGVERSPAMLSRAREAVRNASSPRVRTAVEFSSGDLRSVRLKRQFDAVIALFHVVSYQAADKDLVSAFATARAHLDVGGIFVFDAWYGPAVLAQRPETRISRVADELCELTRLAEPSLDCNENAVDVKYEVLIEDRNTQGVRRAKEIHRMRYLFAPEVRMLAANTGFDMLRAEEWLTGSPLSLSSWAACFVLRAV